MTAHDLLSQLRANGVDIKTSGDDRLVIDAPRGTVTDDLRTALSANKTALTLNDLPKCHAVQAAGLTKCAKLGRLTPIVTLNGNVVSMPYSIADSPAAD